MWTEIKTNDKMNQTLKDCLELQADNISMYARKRIEELECGLEEAKKRMEAYPDLVKALEEYNELLVEEIESMITLAHVHRWKSTRHEKGKIAREKIAKLKEVTS